MSLKSHVTSTGSWNRPAGSGLVGWSSLPSRSLSANAGWNSEGCVQPRSQSLRDFAMCSDVGSLPDTQSWEEGTFWAVPTLISFGLPCESREPDCVCASEG